MSRRPSPADAAQGPDWIDIGHFLKELDRVHHISVRFELTTGPGHYVGAVSVRLLAGAPQLTETGRAWHYEVTEAFPGHRFKTLEAVVYHLLHRVDAAAGRELWKQERFA